MLQELSVNATDVGQRLDVFCVAHTAGYTRSAIQKAIKEGTITANGQAVKPRYLLKAGDTIVVPTLSKVAPVPVNEAPLPTIPILYEDRDMLVIDKPPGVAVHSGTGGETQTIASWFAARYPQSADVGEGVGRPGIVHRLDKDTSGVLVLAKTQPAYVHLKEQFQRRRAHKEYLALVFGVPGEAKGRINRALARSKRNPMRRTVDPAGKEAITEWFVEEKLADQYTLLRLKPYTGRTHQLRVHMHFLGFPIVADQLYTFKRQRPPQGATRQLLHAEKLTLTMLAGKRRTFTAPLPLDFQKVLEVLRSEQ